jgi:hypothetical protein
VGFGAPTSCRSSASGSASAYNTALGSTPVHTCCRCQRARPRPTVQAPPRQAAPDPFSDPLPADACTAHDLKLFLERELATVVDSLDTDDPATATATAAAAAAAATDTTQLLPPPPSPPLLPLQQISSVEKLSTNFVNSKIENSKIENSTLETAISDKEHAQSDLATIFEADAAALREWNKQVADLSLTPDEHATAGNGCMAASQPPAGRPARLLN